MSKLIVLIYTFIFLVSCNKLFTENFQKRIVPKGSVNIVLESQLQSSNDLQNNTAVEISPTNNNFATFLPDNYVLLAYVSTTLDFNDIEEEVILYTTHNSGIVYLLIASVDSNLQKFSFVWQTELKVFDKKPVFLFVRDITGDGRKEIIVQGTLKELGNTNNANINSNENSIEVFHLPSEKSKMTEYTRVFDAVSNEDINIEESLNKNDTVFPIALYDLDEKKNIVKTIYQWSVSRKQYIYFNTQIFTQSNILKEKINALYYGNSAQWQSHLKGIWKKEDVESVDLFISFTDDIPQIVVYKKDTIQAFEWMSMVRTISGDGIGAQVSISNFILPNTKKWISLQIFDDSAMDVFFGNNSDDIVLNGKYIKLSNKEVIDTVFVPLSDNLSLYKSNMLAVYIKKLNKDFIDVQSNTNYSFSYPTVEITEENTETQLYYFNVFKIGSEIVLQTKNYFSSPQKNNFYVIESQDIDKTFDGKSEKIILQPVYLSAHNVYKILESPVIELAILE